MPSSSKKVNNINVLPPRTKEEKLAAIFGPASSTTAKKKVQPARAKAQKMAVIHHGTSTTSPVVGQRGATNKKTLQQIKSEQREKLRLAQEWAIHGTATTTITTPPPVNHAKMMKTPHEILLEQREKIRRAQKWAKEQQRGLELQEERCNDDVIRRASSSQTSASRASAGESTTPSGPSTLESRASSPSVYVIFGTLIGM